MNEADFGGAEPRPGCQRGSQNLEAVSCLNPVLRATSAGPAARCPLSDWLLREELAEKSVCRKNSYFKTTVRGTFWPEKKNVIHWSRSWSRTNVKLRLKGFKK